MAKEGKIKILAIGNSYSQDATACVELLTDKLYVRNLDIGGCSLEKHVALCRDNARAYAFEHNGNRLLAEDISLQEALRMEDWDYITVQQASRLSGKKASYYPYLTELIDFLKQNTRAEILFQQTWAYEKNYDREEFSAYDNSQEKMWREIEETTVSVCQKEGLRMIPSGALIAKLRQYEYFDVERGGISLQRDGSHLNMDYGRIGVGGLWVKFFTGEIPPYLYRNDLPEGYAYLVKALEETGAEKIGK